MWRTRGQGPRFLIIRGNGLKPVRWNQLEGKWQVRVFRLDGPSIKTSTKYFKSAVTLDFPPQK